MKEWEYLTKEKKADICVLDMPYLDTREGKGFPEKSMPETAIEIMSYAKECDEKIFN